MLVDGATKASLLVLVVLVLELVLDSVELERVDDVVDVVEELVVLLISRTSQYDT